MKTFVQYLLYSIYQFCEKSSKWSNPSRYKNEAELRCNIILVIIFYVLLYSVVSIVISVFNINLTIKVNEIIEFGLGGMVVLYFLFGFIINYDKVRVISLSEKEKMNNLIIAVTIILIISIVKIII